MVCGWSSTRPPRSTSSCELTAAEHDCCQFFGFVITVDTRIAL